MIKKKTSYGNQPLQNMFFLSQALNFKTIYLAINI